MTNQERLWRSEFGDQYLERNPVHIAQREVFWNETQNFLKLYRVLEVGCGSGINLRHLDRWCEVWGVDINPYSVSTCMTNVPDAQVVEGSIYDIPFKDNFFDMVFTCGVLIHQPPELIPKAINEVIRCSSRYVMSIEYESEEFEKMPYHGEVDALWKGPYSTLYKEHGLTQLSYGLLTRDQGFDDCVWSLFEL